tara:strand:- start:2311 stop:2505 length:195 start_codon:yes stop_codon:yes gene_type:complete
MIILIILAVWIFLWIGSPTIDYTLEGDVAKTLKFAFTVLGLMAAFVIIVTACAFLPGYLSGLLR